ncbi:MAG: phosphatase PAP2 family protein [Promethearchaeota archaeon]
MELREFTLKIDKWDKRIILRYNGKGGKPILYILKFVSFFGRETLWFFLIFFYIFIWYDPFLFSYISSTFLIGLLFILVIKQIVNRARPFEKFNQIELKVFERKPTSKSFPSWHSYNIVSQGLLFGLFFLRSPLITILIIVFSIIVSFSRIQLGVHYPSDVIAGFCIGIIGFFLSIYIISPIFLNTIIYLEQFITYEIQYRKINSWLYEKIWYLLLTILIFCILLLIAIYKKVKEIIKTKLLND